MCTQQWQRLKKTSESGALIASRARSCSGLHSAKLENNNLTFGVYEKIDERGAINTYQVTPLDTKWIDANKAIEGEPVQISDRESLHENSYVEPSQTCMR